MTKDNFICPCCGLPNHLEFKSRDDYDSYLDSENEDVFQVNDNSQFSWYTLNDEENEDNRRNEIQKRFNLINLYSERFYKTDEETQEKKPMEFKDWFLQNVVGFLPDNEQISIILTQINLKTKIQEILTLINLKTKIQEILTQIYNKVLIQETLTEIMNHIIYEEKTSDDLIHISYTYEIIDEAKKVTYENRRTGEWDTAINHYPTVQCTKTIQR